jgi:hypothetical protein
MSCFPATPFDPSRRQAAVDAAIAAWHFANLGNAATGIELRTRR